MKHLLLLLLFIPAFLVAQNEERYLVGAVPVKDGKVVFSREISAATLSKGQIYDILLKWAQGNFNNDNSRIVYTSEAKGEIAIVGEDYLVFSSTALSLDRTLMSYRVTVVCNNHSCQLEITGIRYKYNVSYQQEPEKYLAEEWITDKQALNKDKDKLSRITGKFRKMTIDFADKTFDSAASALGVMPVASVVPMTPIALAAPVAPQEVKEGFVAFDANKIPNTIIQMLPDNTMTVTARKDASQDTNAVWKGLGNMFGKTIASISVNPSSPVYKGIGNDGIYTISFMKKEASSEGEWMIIECRKQGETSEGSQMTILGEVLNVWIK